MTPFSLKTPPRVEIGAGGRRFAVDAAASMGTRSLIFTGSDPGRAAWLVEALAARGVATQVCRATGEPTVEDVRTTVAEARDFRPDVLLGIGGGAAIDLAKATAGLMRETGDPLDHLEVVGAGKPLTSTPPPLIALPTTAGAGAEATINAVLFAPEHRRKVSLRDPRLMPTVAIVDPDLLRGLPQSVAAASGLDAIVQVIEPFLSRFANPVTDALCRDAIPRGLAALPRLLESEDPDARADLALTAFVGGVALTNAKLGAVHGLAGVIGGRTSVAHGAICGRLAAPVLELTEARSSESQTREKCAAVRGWIAKALGGASSSAWSTLDSFTREAGVGAIGLAAEAAAIADAAMASSSMSGSPADLTPAMLAEIMREA